MDVVVEEAMSENRGGVFADEKVAAEAVVKLLMWEVGSRARGGTGVVEDFGWRFWYRFQEVFTG